MGSQIKNLITADQLKSVTTDICEKTVNNFITKSEFNKEIIKVTESISADVPTKTSDLTNDSGFITSSDLPTKVSDLTNDSGFITNTVDSLINYYLKSEAYNKTEVDTIVSTIKNSRFEVVNTLPTEDIKTNVIYLTPSLDPSVGDIKDEYINLDGTTSGWERIASTDIEITNYINRTDLNNALADYTNTVDLTALLNAKQDQLQYSSLPTASEDYLGKVFEYVGETTNEFTHGYFYECVSDGEATPTYSWVQTNVQPSGSTGGGHTIEDSEGTDLTQRDTLQFGEGFLAEDDDTNEKTVITPDVMPSEDMSEVISPLPSVMPRTDMDLREEHNILFVDGVATMALDTIRLYVNSSTGVDDYEGGYGFIRSKPFKTIQYAMQYLPRHSKNAQSVNLYLTGTFTSTNEYYQSLEFSGYTNKLQIWIYPNVVFNNVSFCFRDCVSVLVSIDTACTFNITDTTLATRIVWCMIFWCIASTVNITQWNNAPTVTVVGNATSKARIRGFSVSQGSSVWAAITFNISQAVVGVQCEQRADCYIGVLQGSNLNNSINAYHGSMVAYTTNSTDIATTTGQGGRIYTGTQS